MLATAAFSPLGILAISVVLVIVAIGVLRLHAFFALVLGAIVVGRMSAARGTDPHRFVRTIDTVMAESGIAMGRLGFAIAMAAVIGMCLLESSAADKIIRRMIALLGEKRASVALLIGRLVVGGTGFIGTGLLVPR